VWCMHTYDMPAAGLGLYFYCGWGYLALCQPVCLLPAAIFRWLSHPQAVSCMLLHK
jgi:hypothetical protein